MISFLVNLLSFATSLVSQRHHPCNLIWKRSVTRASRGRRSLSKAEVEFLSWTLFPVITGRVKMHSWATRETISSTLVYRMSLSSRETRDQRHGQPPSLANAVIWSRISSFVLDLEIELMPRVHVDRVSRVKFMKEWRKSSFHSRHKNRSRTTGWIFYCSILHTKYRGSITHHTSTPRTSKLDTVQQ
jgi:hypothetical protein